MPDCWQSVVSGALEFSGVPVCWRLDANKRHRVSELTVQATEKMTVT